MDIYTDASLNDQKKIAGIGMVFVYPTKKDVIKSQHSFLKTDNIETAELFAIHQAIIQASSLKPYNMRLFSDSIGSLRKIQRVFQYPDQYQIHTINNPFQKRILCHLSLCFQMMINTKFSFHYIKGHQARPAPATSGYYNMLADHEASSGRLFAEILCQSTLNSPKSDTNSLLVDLPEVYWTASPRHISFHYEDLPQKQKFISRFIGHKKSPQFRHKQRISSFVTKSRC